MGRDSSVGIATRYGLESPGIESWWRQDFPHPSRPVLGPTQLAVQWIPGLSRGVKRPGRGAHHPPPSQCRGHERVGLYLYSPSGPQWHVIGRTFTFKYLNDFLHYKTHIHKANSLESRQSLSSS